MIPVVVDPSCRDTSTWQGIVGGKLGGHLYIDLTSDHDLGTAVRRLHEQITSRSEKQRRSRASEAISIR